MYFIGLQQLLMGGEYFQMSRHFYVLVSALFIQHFHYYIIFFLM